MLIVCSPLLKFVNGNPLAELQKAESTIKAECIKQGWDPAEVYSCLSTVYQKANDMIVQYSQQYSYIIISGQILLTFQSYLSLLIISEGKQELVVLAAIIANLLNLLLDYIFINFFQMAIVGGAIATIIGWGFNCCWYFIQIYVYNKHNDTTLIYKALNLKQYAWDWKIVKNIIFIGLASFLRNLSMGIALWLQLFLLVNFIIPKIGSSGATASSYTNFYGAVNPIYNLLFPVLLGTIQGSRIMCSYLYGAESWKRFRQTYWVAMSIGLVYGTFVVILFGLILNKYMLIAFNVNPNVQNFNDAKTMLIIALMQLPVYSFTIWGQIIFQATVRSLLASICALMQGLICNIPISFAMIGISIAVNSLTLFLWTPLIVVCFSSAIICTWTLIYMKKHFSPDLKLQVNK